MWSILISLAVQEPYSILQMRANRDGIATANIHWSIKDSTTGESQTFRYRRGKNGDQVSFREMSAAEEENMTFFDPAKPLPPFAILLDDDDTVWQRNLGTMTISRFVRSPQSMMGVEFISPLWVGHDTSLASGVTSSELWERIVSYLPEEGLPDGRIRVLGKFENNDAIEWTINPQKAWNAEKIVSRDWNGRILGSMEIQLELMGGTWFPRSAHIFEGEQSTPRSSFLLLSDTLINDSSLPADLTARHLGADAGFVIRDFTKGNGGTWSDVWDGEKAIPVSQWQQAVAAGVKKIGSETTRIRARTENSIRQRANSVGKSALPDFPDCWDVYVAAFCDAYKLDSAQKRRAEDILETCKKRAVRLAERDPAMHAELTQLREQLGKDGEWHRSARSFVVNNAAKLKPVRDIFQEELMPRLFKLPTEKQIEECGDPEKIRESEKNKKS